MISILNNVQLVRNLASLVYIVFLAGSLVISLVRFEWGLALFFMVLPILSRVSGGIFFKLGPVMISAETFFIVVLLFAWILRSLKEKRFTVTSTRLDLPVLLLVSAGILSLANADDPIESSRVFIVGVIQLIVLYYIIVNNIRSHKQIIIILYSAMVGFLIGTAYSIHIFLSRGEQRLGYIWGNSVRGATFVNMLLPLVIALLFIPKTRYKKCINTFLVLVIGIMFMSQYLSASRTGLIGLVFILFAFLWDKRFRRIIWKLTPLIIIVIIILVVSFGNILLSTMQDGLLYKRLASGGFLLGGRLNIWKSSIAIIADHPLFGIGPYNFKEIYPSYMLWEESTEYLSAHNLFLQTWIELGFLGLLALLCILVISFREAITNFRHCSNEVSKVLCFALLISLCTIILNSFTNATLIVQTFGVTTLSCATLSWSLLAFIQVLKKERYSMVVSLYAN